MPRGHIVPDLLRGALTLAVGVLEHPLRDVAAAESEREGKSERQRGLCVGPLRETTGVMTCPDDLC